jgi:hypothetical protein
MKRLSILGAGSVFLAALLVATPAGASAGVLRYHRSKVCPNEAGGASTPVVAAMLNVSHSHRPKPYTIDAVEAATLNVWHSHRPMPYAVETATLNVSRSHRPKPYKIDDHEDDDRGDFDGGIVFANPYWGSYWGPAWGWDPAWYWNGPGYDGYSNASGIRLEVKGPSPKDAVVYVNGAYAGVVNDFNSWYQRLKLAPGTYGLKIEAKGYQPLSLKVAIPPDQTIVYKGALKPVA